MTRPANSQKGIRLSDRQRLNWLRLIRSENVGPVTFRDLISHFGSAGDALQMLPELMRRGGGNRPIRVATVEDAEREMELIDKIGARFVGMGEPDYPPYLRHYEASPPLLAIKGDASLFEAPPVAIVGARNSSIAGNRFTHRLVKELGDAGYAIVSGLARGIDAAAHEASLETGTIAVLAGGLDKPYPPENMHLYNAIPEKNGVLVSEMPMGWEPRARDFPRRNRIIAGISLGLVVIEAANRSGSLISARLAGEMGRLLFAVPGSPLDPRSFGTNKLLKNGAILVTEASDIIEALTPLIGPLNGQKTGPMGGATGELPFNAPTQDSTLDEAAVSPMMLLNDPERESIIDALSPVPTDPDALIRHTGLHPSQVFLVLLELDLAGRIARHSGGAVSLLQA
ncbi:DNA-protecting protein DprA [Phyllobacterium salinisoli]|uniref:DNA-protecting protein DprA n=1 Tax=Phyllobacterium salinisoli TaxID=1899321 RepID=A0A368JXW2_9HYPH|nr:DNA-processing protein DprA [Phyllobacterium salinisoli]RCS21989.1 DNA-protecting protein DprA [Phyllobacterium salinisoli]